MLEVVGDAGEEADGGDLVVVGFGDEGLEDGVAGAEAAAVGRTTMERTSARCGP